MASKQRHDLGRQKRIKALPEMMRARSRRQAAKSARRERVESSFMRLWLRTPIGQFDYDKWIVRDD